MAVTAKVTEITRAIDTLNGLLKGIVSDADINELEISELKFWLDHHKYLDSIYPLSEIYQIIEASVQSKSIDRYTRQELLDYCCFDICEGNNVVDKLTQDIRILHGFMHGIIADHKVKAEELRALKNWISYHQEHIEKWPFYHLAPMIDQILLDGIVTPDEENEFVEYAKEFTEEVGAEGIVDKSIFINQWMMNDSPAFKTIANILDDIDIQFEKKSFCFTGQMRTMKRIDAAGIVAGKGGIHHDNVIVGTNYLVIGALSNPAWAYSTYGRKIEKVMNNRKKGLFTYLIGEEKFIESIG